ncbi:MAG: chalcone isomerase family protein [Acidobacteria bacterium]|nr:chalcone isomerase family protein [Acidobacteriota bacterium]
MKKATLVIMGFAMFAAAGLWAQATTVTESETGKSFDVHKSIGGQDHVLIGVGAREAYGAFNVYAAGMYIQESSGGSSWQRFLTNQAASFVTDGEVNWSGLKDSSTLYQWIYSGSFGKAIWMKFVRDVTGQQVVDAYKETLKKSIDDFDTAVAQSPLKDFLEAANHDVANGAEMMLWTRGSDIHLKSGSNAEVTISDASSIIRPIWRIWFGPEPIQVPLRRGMVNNVENLGGPTAAAE